MKKYTYPIIFVISCESCDVLTLSNYGDTVNIDDILKIELTDH